MKFTVHSVRTRRWSRGLIMHSCRRAKKDCLLSTFVSQMSKSLHVKNVKEKASNLKSLKIGQRPTLRALWGIMQNADPWEWDNFFPVPKTQSSSLRELWKKKSLSLKRVTSQLFVSIFIAFDLALKIYGSRKLFRLTWPKVKDSHKTLHCLLISMANKISK